MVRTHIGYGSPNKQDTFEAHGSPLGADEVKRTKENLRWPLDPPFWIPPEALNHFRRALLDGKQAEAEWDARFAEYEKRHSPAAAELRRAMRGELAEGWNRDIPTFPTDAKGMATRVASGKVLNALSPSVPTLIGGSADLNPSTMTAITGAGDFQNPGRADGDLQGSVGGGWSYAGRNIAFGVREHAMGAIVNGMAAHGGTIPFGATFLIFSDYMRPAIRLAAVMKLHSIFVFTHDSIGLGEDGPTHQPVEQLVALRAIPHLYVIRPCDANETAVAWCIAVETRDRPVALVLTRQNVPTLNRSQLAPADGVRKGAYILADTSREKPDLIFIATGSEVHLALAAREQMVKQDVGVRVVSMPCTELFMTQPPEYREEVLPHGVPRLVIEAGATLGWRSYFESADAFVGVDKFGASAPGDTVMREYGLTVDSICHHALALLGSGIG